MGVFPTVDRFSLLGTAIASSFPIAKESPVERTPPETHAGFVTLEVMVAAGLLATGLLATLGHMTDTNRHAEFTRMHATARLAAESRLETISARGFEELEGLTGSGNSVELLASFPDDGAGNGLEITGDRMKFALLAPGLASLIVDLSWKRPGERVSHHIRCFKIMSRPDHSWLKSIPLPAIPTERTTRAD
jgi:hypothetical protein